MYSIMRQKGYTLVELMIAIVLGLLIIAAVTQVYITGTRTALVQEAGSNILDANVFGLQQIERNIRLAGLGLSEKSTLNTNGAAVVFTQNNLLNIANFNPTSHASRMTGLPTNIAAPSSHQLTVQYRAPMDMRDCEGQLALGPRKAILEQDSEQKNVDGQVIVERYFLSGTPPNLELRCDAGRYVTERIATDMSQDATAHILAGNANQLLNFGDAGALVVSGVDDFQIRLAVANGSALQYLNIDDYIATHADKSIVGVQVALLARGSKPVNISNTSNTQYEIFGKQYQMNPLIAAQTHIRRVYEANSMLRNSRDR